ncbi:hypothetical protein [Chitinophaga sp. sic0106]|uniref:hypothetical protein n=1 Tax=Chitinophaga sp. sic0106 TaxID=2854785 RepID=UPI001C47A890|nr:hypothetical protein [Chitinophaga sp. sic0106]MBV7533750.1 hypothetical protein [Chitinophaga sp. sic0106]
MKPIIVVMLVMITLSASPSASAPASAPEVFRPIDSMIVMTHHRNVQQLDTTMHQLQDAAAQYTVLAKLIHKNSHP